MKKLLLISAIIGLFSFGALAQDSGNNDNQISKTDNVKTLFGNSNQKQEYGWYASLLCNFTQIDGLSSVMVGARGSAIFNHSFAIGIGGNGFAGMETKIDNRLCGDDYYFNGGYGGLYLEPIVAYKSPVHVSFPILFGAGAFAYSPHWDNSSDKDYSEDECVFFILEPSVELEFNLIKHVRLDVTAGYRLTSDVNLYYKRNDEERSNGCHQRICPTDVLRGFSAGLTLKFGNF